MILPYFQKSQISCHFHRLSLAVAEDQLARSDSVLLFTWAIALCYELLYRLSLAAAKDELARSDSLLLFTWAIFLCYELCQHLCSTAFTYGAR